MAVRLRHMKKLLLFMLLALFGSCRADEVDLSLKLRPRDTYVFVGVGSRVLYQIGGKINRLAMELEGQLVFENYWPIQEEMTTRHAGHWKRADMEKLIRDLNGCASALLEQKEFES